MGMSEKQIRTWIQKALEASDKEMDHIFSDEAYREYYGHARAYKLADLQQIPFEQNTFLQQLLEVTKQRLKSEYRNIAGSMGFAIRDPATGKIRSAPLMEYYRSTLDNAVMDIHSGAFDYNTVLRRTINQMTASGIRYIEYDSGHRDRVNVAVRRAVLTGFRQVQGKLNEQVAADLNTDQYEVSYHVGARPTHQSWQGKVWSMQQLKEVCGLGEITGLCGINCYHTYRVFSPGSVRTYTDKQLAEMVKEENTPKEYNGKQYATYEALQQQRKMERGMRAQRQRIKLLEEGGADEQEIILAKAKYQGQMQTYKDFSEKMGLPEQKARIMQDGLRGRFMPTKSEQKFLEESVINDKIKADMKAAGLRGEINLKPQIPDVSKLSFDEHHVNQERQHNVTEAEAKSYIQNAVFSTTKWKGKFTNYYSDEGAAFVDNEAQHIKTAFKKEQYDKAATAAMEVLKRGRS